MIRYTLYSLEIEANVFILSYSYFQFDYRLVNNNNNNNMDTLLGRLRLAFPRAENPRIPVMVACSLLFIRAAYVLPIRV